MAYSCCKQINCLNKDWTRRAVIGIAYLYQLTISGRA